MKTLTETDIQMLKNHGIKYPWLRTTGEDKNNISSGVFITEASALIMTVKQFRMQLRIVGNHLA
jgi:hypothetical protein